MTRKDFNTSLKKGDIGEQIFRKYLEDRGWIVYCPFTKDKAHYFDQLATKNKEKVIALDIKTKARLNKWAKTGINIKSYNEYMKFVKTVNVPFYLVFIDDKNGDVYTQELKKLKNGELLTSDIIVWELKDMNYLFNIGKDNIELLSRYDQREYEYKPNTESA